MFSDYILEFINEYSYFILQSWPVRVFLLAFVIVPIFCMLLSMAPFYICIVVDRLKRKLSEDERRKAALDTVHGFIDRLGRIWHGYEIRGIEKIPKGGVIMILYHGTFAIDAFYYIARIYKEKNIVVHGIMHTFYFRLPGFKTFAKYFNISPGSQKTCCELLEKGGMLATAPGGEFEAKNSDHLQYKPDWKNRIGFAKIALNAKVPIVPMFTENIREGFRGIKNTIWFYGGFPVKLITHIGDPIEYDPSLSPEELRDKVMEGMRKLIEEKQRIPGNIPLALLDRLTK